MTKSRDSAWFVYMVRCSDDTLYTGITTEPGRRCREHNLGRASRYTRSRRPVELVYLESAASKSEALRREAALKGLSRGEKDGLLRRAA